jgi:hypothetical protein
LIETQAIFIILVPKIGIMLIEDDLKRIYLNYKIKEILPFLRNRSFRNVPRRYCNVGFSHLAETEFAFSNVLFFSFSGEFSKGETFSGTAFEAIIHKIIPADFDIVTLGIMIGEKISIGLLPVKRLAKKLCNSMSLNTSHNRAFKKLVISILSIIEQPVFNLKKLLEFYEKLLNINQT